VQASIVRDKALMNKLNESASWVSDVSDTRSESETKLPDQRDEEEEEAKHAKIQLAEGECLRLGEMLNQSVTWKGLDMVSKKHGSKEPLD